MSTRTAAFFASATLTAGMAVAQSNFTVTPWNTGDPSISSPNGASFGHTLIQGDPNQLINRLSVSGYAGPGAGVFAQGETHTEIEGPIGGGGACGMTSSAWVSDFIITGPPDVTSVQATLPIDFSGSVSVYGGYPNQGTTAGQINVSLGTPVGNAAGVFTWSNAGSTFTGMFLGGAYGGVTTPSVGGSVAFTGLYPVNRPFSITLVIQAYGLTYGNRNNTPINAAAVAVAGFSTAHPLMDLPPGYTLNSTSGYIIDNMYHPPCTSPTIQWWSGDVTVCRSDAANFPIIVAGTWPLAYRWSVESPANSGNYVELNAPSFSEPVSGLSFDLSVTVTGELAVSSVRRGTHPGVIRFVAVASNACGSITSAPAVLTICPADFSCDGSVNSQDFFDFLTAFFASDPSADFNHDGAINSQDFFDFLTAFFVGC